MQENFGSRLPIEGNFKKTETSYSRTETVTFINGKMTREIKESGDPDNIIPVDKEFDEKLDYAYPENSNNLINYSDNNIEMKEPQNSQSINRDDFRKRASEMFRRFDYENRQKGFFLGGKTSLLNNFGGFFNKRGNENIGNTAGFDPDKVSAFKKGWFTKNSNNNDIV